MAEPAPRVQYRFGHFRVDPHQRLFFADGRERTCAVAAASLRHAALLRAASRRPALQAGTAGCDLAACHRRGEQPKPARLDAPACARRIAAARIGSSSRRRAADIGSWRKSPSSNHARPLAANAARNARDNARAGRGSLSAVSASARTLACGPHSRTRAERSSCCAQRLVAIRRSPARPHCSLFSTRRASSTTFRSPMP